MTFEENLKKLDEIAGLLSNENVSIDKSIELFKNGLDYFEQALKTLCEGQGKVTVLKQQLDSLLDYTADNNE